MNPDAQTHQDPRADQLGGQRLAEGNSRTLGSAGRTPAFETASAALIVVIGAWLLWRALTPREHAHGGKMLAIVAGFYPCPLTTFIMSYAMAQDRIGAGLLVTAAMAGGMVVTVGGIAATAIIARAHLMNILARTEAWRDRAGRTLEIGSSAAVLALGLWFLFKNI